MTGLAGPYRAAYRSAPAIVRRRLVDRRPPFVSRFDVGLPDGERIALQGLDDVVLLRRLFWSGFDGYEPHFSRVFHRLAKGANSIIDLGSYVGYYALIAAAANPQARILSVEPVPGSMAIQRRLLALNGFANVALCEAAIAERPGSATFYLPDKSASRIPNIGSLANRFGKGTHYEDRQATVIEVATLPLDELVDRHCAIAPELIKFYVEEREHLVFASGRRTLEAHRPDLLGWIFHRHDHVERLGRLLDEMSYAVFAFRGHALVRCRTLTEVRTCGDVFGLHRGGRSPVFATTEPEDRLRRLEHDHAR